MSSLNSKGRYKFHPVNINKSKDKKNSNNKPSPLRFRIRNRKEKFNISTKIMNNATFFNQKSFMDNSFTCNKLNNTINLQKKQLTENKKLNNNQKKYNNNSNYQTNYLNYNNSTINENKNSSKYNTITKTTPYLFTTINSKQKRNKEISNIKKKIIKLDYSINRQKNNFDNNKKNIEDLITDKNYENEIDEEDIINENNNNNYENLKNDFQLMYIKNYEKMINDDMLNLEIQLLYEKIIELQLAYYTDFNNFYNKCKNIKKNINDIIAHYKDYKKKLINLKKLNEANEKKSNTKKLIHDNKRKMNENLINIHNNECDLWNQIFGIEHTNMHRKEIKRAIEDIFKSVVIEKYAKIKKYMTELEKKITLNLMKKFHYHLNNNKNNSNLSSTTNMKNDRINLNKDKNYGKSKTANLSNNKNHSKNLNSSFINKKNRDKSINKKKY